jgi:selenocysteine lyase/cysteine desulfurase
MLHQIGIASFIRLSGSHYNTPQDVEQFLRATSAFADHADRSTANAGRGASLAR